MSGPLKLKIKLKQRPQEPEFAPGPSDHKRKRDEYSPQPVGVPTSTANGHRSEVKRPKKQKQHQQGHSQPQITSSGNKVKLHIKGPWSKAASASDSKDLPLRQSSSGHPHSQGKAVHQGPSVVLKQRPPAKAVQVIGQGEPAQAFKPPSKKPKLKLKQQQNSSAADGALGANATDGAASVDAAPGIKTETVPGQVEAPMIPKSEGNPAIAVLTQTVLERIVDKMQRKDNFNIFKEPVTEAVAPGYFQVVQRGMDFTTMRSKVQGDAYTTWQDFQEDMDVMFGNAMAYNSPDTVYHKQARSLKTVAAKMIELAKQGVIDFRGKTVQESRAHNAQIAAEEQAYRNEQRSAKSASLAVKVAEQFGAAGSGMSLRHMSTAGSHAEAAESSGQPARAAPRVHRPVVRESDMRKFAGQEEQNNRATYWQTPSAQFYARWKGLAAGASAESVALQPGRAILRPLILLGRDSYARSIARFTSGLKGKFREMAKAKAAPCVFPDPASHPQPSHPVQLPSSSIPGMTPSLPVLLRQERMGVLLLVPVPMLDKRKAHLQPQSLRHIYQRHFYQERHIYQQQE
ncbi:hypothetical protein WJX77_007012 [Trebouxia sp. C0004]